MVRGADDNITTIAFTEFSVAASSIDIIQELTQVLTPEQVMLDPWSLETYGQDWTRFTLPAPSAVVFPRDTADVVAIVECARRCEFALVPSGGRTGLSGGACAANGEVVVSMDKLNIISTVNLTDRTLTVGAGAITQNVQQAASDAGLFYPVDFASSGSSQIGGNIATNAGGINVIRYGMTREWVAGLTVVTGKGEILELNKGLMKNNTGLDFRHLFIGSEGILGFITEATLKLTAPPKDPTVLVLGLSDMTAIMSVLDRVQSTTPLLAYEFFSELAVLKVVEHAGVTRPFETQTPFYALVEFERENETTDAHVFEAVEQCMEAGWVVDAVMSQSVAQARALWRLREDISETISQWTPYKNDISSTVSKVPQLLSAVDAVVHQNYPDWEVVWYGHIGDGNLHLNILKPENLLIEDFKARCNDVSADIFEAIKALGGSVSAEHGVGTLKAPYLNYTKSESEIDAMRAIKSIFDPNGILNPGKVFSSG
ncbi:MAG: FAD-binding oxidoreductase [Luminiphilus sp.]|jgi:FAD/FMN-containing dehydrogenase|nr:FAD-binding oxidoreductase [Luminiphilus sp.]